MSVARALGQAAGGRTVGFLTPFCRNSSAASGRMGFLSGGVHQDVEEATWKTSWVVAGHDEGFHTGTEQALVLVGRIVCGPPHARQVSRWQHAALRRQMGLPSAPRGVLGVG